MCGITGAIAFSAGGRKFVANSGLATSELQKRGPDGNGTFDTEMVALGHCRLSVIDPSGGANQPMYSADNRFVIVFNGEIFNYQELKAAYLAGQSFKTTSDTEVFLKLFERLGAAAFSLLRGFFAAAIWDAQMQELYLVRDRFGKKPLLYYRSADAVVFASEMKALLAFGIPRQIEWNILPLYLQLNYVPQPYSLLQGVHKLPPGKYLKIKGSSIEEHTYHTLQTSPAHYGSLSYEAAQEQLVAKMDEAVRLRLIADVPLGAFLSGGIDSSVVTALAARHIGKLNTFSIGYKDHPYFDETRYAALVAKMYNTNHTVFSLGNADFVDHVHNVLDYIDEPFADSSAIPQYILSYHTRKHVTVALSGDGGDEVFGGYNKHAGEWQLRNRDWKAKAVIALDPLWKALPHSRSNRVANAFRQLHRFSSAGRLSAKDRFWQLATLLPEDRVHRLLSQQSRSSVSQSLRAIKEQYTAPIETNDFNEVLLADMKLVLLSDMLVKVDLMSMANSLEVRSPFLDQEVVAFAFGLPASFKIHKGFKKKIVQDAFKSLLPAELYNRPKQGFEIPLRDWLRKELWGLIQDDLLQDKFVKEQNIFNPEAVKVLKQQLRSSNPGDSHATIWALIVFQHWWKKYLR